MSTRLFSYLIIWVAYLLFMRNFAPLGIDWLPWHEARIFNFIEYLNIHEYWNSYGFSIWNKCIDCNLSDDISTQIYLSKHSFSFSHLLLINSLLGKDYFIFLGPLIDKAVIFFTAAACAELFLLIIKDLIRIPLFYVGILTFSLFALNPWTYKMILSAWTEIYFLMFFLFALIALIKERHNLGLLFLFLSGLYNYQWSFFVATFIILISVFSYIVKAKPIKIFNFPDSTKPALNFYKVIFSLLFPVLIFMTLKFLADSSIEGVSGSSVLYRIGITGSDIHNGGLLGSFQFLGGNRLSNCLNGPNFPFLSEDLNMRISIYNCLLSLAGMFIISLISLGGFFHLLRKSNLSYILLPLFFALVAMVFTLQQSLSVHLMGYSYIFSVFFSIGLASNAVFAINNSQSSVLRMVFSLPIFAGIIILCIHVSMLTGINS